MNNVLSIKIKEIYNIRQYYEEKYNDLLFNFILSSYELVDLSNGLYQVENSVDLNQISIKDYILNSKLYVYLNNNYNFADYSFYDLKNVINELEEKNIDNLLSYKLAFSLYEKLEEIKNIEILKINYLLNNIGNIFENVNNIKDVNKDNYLTLFDNILKQLDEMNIDDNEIKSYTIEILKDIFNYYLYGNRKIHVDI